VGGGRGGEHLDDQARLAQKPRSFDRSCPCVVTAVTGS
jgi:hypothetical protein